jgi:hypothetical protein
MTIRITAMLADSAEAVNGKLYLLGGGWDTLAVTHLPTVQSRVAVAVLVRTGWNDTDEPHQLTLHLETEDGDRVPLARGGDAPIDTLAARITTHRSPLIRPGDDQNAPLTFTINDLVLDRVGGFSWVITVDGEPVERLPMRVLLREQDA